MSIGSIVAIELDCFVESNELLFDGDIEDDAVEIDAFVETDVEQTTGIAYNTASENIKGD